jgi:chaperonin GroES
MNIQPLADRVVLQQIESEEVTASGIILPDSAKEKPEKAKVIAVGQDVKLVKTGDIVLYNTYVSPTKHNGEEYIIVKEEDILATIKGDK